LRPASELLNVVCLTLVGDCNLHFFIRILHSWYFVTSYLWQQ